MAPSRVPPHPPPRGRSPSDQRPSRAGARVVRLSGDGDGADRVGALAQERADPRAARPPRTARRARTAAVATGRDAGPPAVGPRAVSGGAGVTAFDPNAAASEGGIFGLPHSPAEARVVLIPVPFEATTSYGGGTSNGPRAILEASRHVDLFVVETGKPYEHGVAMLEESPDVPAWVLGSLTAASHC